MPYNPDLFENNSMFATIVVDYPTIKYNTGNTDFDLTYCNLCIEVYPFTSTD